MTSDDLELVPSYGMLWKINEDRGLSWNTPHEIPNSIWDIHIYYVYDIYIYIQLYTYEYIYIYIHMYNELYQKLVILSYVFGDPWSIIRRIAAPNSILGFNCFVGSPFI